MNYIWTPDRVFSLGAGQEEASHVSLGGSKSKAAGGGVAQVGREPSGETVARRLPPDPLRVFDQLVSPPWPRSLYICPPRVLQPCFMAALQTLSKATARERGLKLNP